MQQKKRGGHASKPVSFETTFTVSEELVPHRYRQMSLIGSSGLEALFRLIRSLGAIEAMLFHPRDHVLRAIPLRP